MKEVMPESFKKIDSSNKIMQNLKSGLGKLLGKSPLETANYFHDAHEINAREMAIKVFASKFDELTGGDPKYSKHKEKIISLLTKFNKVVLDIQPKNLLTIFEEEKKNFEEKIFHSRVALRL